MPFQNKLIFLTVLLFEVNAINFRNCGSLFNIKSVYMEGCENTAECILYIGERVKFRCDFAHDSATVNISNLQQHLAVVVEGYEFGLVSEPEDPCQAIVCPLQRNFTTTYTPLVSIPEYFPPLVASFRMKMEAEFSQVVCVEFPVKLLKRQGA